LCLCDICLDFYSLVWSGGNLVGTGEGKKRGREVPRARDDNVVGFYRRTVETVKC
jgi:hypothetical protein